MSYRINSFDRFQLNFLYYENRVPMCTAAAAATTAFLSGNVVGLVWLAARSANGRMAPVHRCCTNTRVRNAFPTFMQIVLDNII